MNKNLIGMLLSVATFGAFAWLEFGKKSPSKTTSAGASPKGFAPAPADDSEGIIEKLESEIKKG